MPLRANEKVFMKIGFLYISNPGDVNRHYPLGFAYLTGYLRTHLSVPFETVWIDQQTIAEFAEKIDLLCVSCISQDFDDLQRAVRTFKERHPDVPAVLGGNHITNFPDTLPDCVDIGVIGEGEVTFCELVSLWHRDKLFDLSCLNSIDGIVFRTAAGELKKTKSRALIQNLDEIGLPDRSIFPDAGRALYLLTSRGCPYDCSFCSTALFWKKPRFFSPRYIANDMETTLELAGNPGVISIWDDLFIADTANLGQLSDLLKDRKVIDDVVIHANVRANLVSPQVCMILQRLHVTGVSFGFESACERSLRKLKPAVTVTTNLRALEVLKEFNIGACCSFMLGIPGETEAETRCTLDTIIDLVTRELIVEPRINILMPMPNTVFWKQAQEQGLIPSDESMQWHRLRYYSSYLDSQFDTPEQWAQARVRNKSIYLNEATVPEETLLGLIVDYEKRITRIREELAVRPRVPYRYFAHVDPSIPNNAHSFVLGQVREHSVVLECGSSGGHVTRALARKGCSIDCVENDITVAGMAYQYAHELFTADLENDAFTASLPSDEYDHIILCDVLEHLKDPVTCLTALKRSLKDNGSVIVSLPNVTHGSIRLKMLKGQFRYEDSGLLDKTHLRFYDFDSLVGLFDDARLSIEQVDMVRVPLDHPLSRIDPAEFDSRILNELANDATAVVFQFVVTAVKMRESAQKNDRDDLYQRLFGPRTDIFSAQVTKKSETEPPPVAEPQPQRYNLRRVIRCLIPRK